MLSGHTPPPKFWLLYCARLGKCIAVLSKNPPEYPGRVIFSLEGYFWFIQEGALPLLIKQAAWHILGDAESTLFVFYQHLSAAGMSKALLGDPVDKGVISTAQPAWYSLIQWQR